MLIKFGRIRVLVTVLPKIPAEPVNQEAEALKRRIELCRANHKKTSHLERELFMVKFGKPANT